MKKLVSDDSFPMQASTEQQTAEETRRSAVSCSEGENACFLDLEWTVYPQYYKTLSENANMNNNNNKKVPQLMRERQL